MVSGVKGDEARVGDEGLMCGPSSGRPDEFGRLPGMGSNVGRLRCGGGVDRTASRVAVSMVEKSHVSNASSLLRLSIDERTECDSCDSCVIGGLLLTRRLFEVMGRTVWVIESRKPGRGLSELSRKDLDSSST